MTSVYLTRRESLETLTSLDQELWTRRKEIPRDAGMGKWHKRQGAFPPSSPTAPQWLFSNAPWDLDGTLNWLTWSCCQRGGWNLKNKFTYWTINIIIKTSVVFSVHQTLFYTLYLQWLKTRTTTWGSYYLHFVSDKSEAREVWNFVQHHTAGKWQSQNPNLGSLYQTILMYFSKTCRGIKLYFWQDWVCALYFICVTLILEGCCEKQSLTLISGYSGTQACWRCCLLYYTVSSLEDFGSNFSLFLVLGISGLLLSNYFVCIL